MELLDGLHSAPEGRAEGAEEEAHRTAVISLVAALKPLVEQIGVLDSRIVRAVRVYPDGDVFLSLFRNPDSPPTAAKILSEIGDRRERYPTAEKLAADASMCPAAKESGKRKVKRVRTLRAAYPLRPTRHFRCPADRYICTCLPDPSPPSSPASPTTTNS